MSDYKPYSKEDLRTLLNEPWEVSSEPYKLHAAFALSCLYDTVFSEEEEPEEAFLWGQTIPKKMLDRMIKDIQEDFNDAAKNYKSIKIWNKPYAIRKVNAYDHNRLDQIFNFPTSDTAKDEYKIVPEGVLDLSGADSLMKYQIQADEAKENREYLRKIIMLAEDDDNDGWEELTDMEIVLYCWAKFFNEFQNDNWLQFKTEYEDYLYADEKGIMKCFNAKSAFRGRPVGMYAFSRQKVMQWNENNNQVSKADAIPEKMADDYWYKVALNNTFKPIDF